MPAPKDRPARPGEARVHAHRRAHQTAHDLGRYAGLFARRTRVMRSSAMRDLTAIAARPEVISLAGGLPDTSTFSPETFAAQMTRISAEVCPHRRCSTGPRRALRPQVLGANAIPGLTDTSLLPMAAEAAGLRFEDLVGRIVDLALTRASSRVALTAQEPGPPAR